ncbi:hypothetical protein D3Y57_17670 [Sphingomonas paeninsulae]|uniref:Uncharacterized protein n=1 Tax=Sphingomonas paeninsulae TaxID=2319844 RepID=A0A494TIU8_SPHPE|nr:hypothetical protein D3Y57_17670 [Sphingomonas paeninsulae]
MLAKRSRAAENPRPIKGIGADEARELDRVVIDDLADPHGKRDRPRQLTGDIAGHGKAVADAASTRLREDQFVVGGEVDQACDLAPSKPRRPELAGAVDRVVLAEATRIEPEGIARGIIVHAQKFRTARLEIGVLGQSVIAEPGCDTCSGQYVLKFFEIPCRGKSVDIRLGEFG